MVQLNFKSIFRGTKKVWGSFIEPGSKISTPLISAAIAAKTKNPQSAQITNKILKSLTGGKISILTDILGNGLRLKVLWFISNIVVKSMSSCIKDLYDYNLI